MTPSPTPTKPAAAPTPAPTESTWERLREGMADGIHNVENWVRPGEEALAADMEKAAAETWKAAAGAIVILINRNDAELAQRIEKGLMTYLLALAPGAAPEADVMATLALNEAKVFLDFVKGKLEAQAATPLAPIGPPLTPTPTVPK